MWESLLTGIASLDTMVVMVQTTQMKELQTPTLWLARPGTGHAAQFYADDLRCSGCVLEYVHSGLNSREMCVAIATPGKLISLQKELRRRGVDIGTALAEGRYITYDAEELLASFISDRVINVRRFNVFADRLIRHVATAKRPVRVFGEMTALLRQQKNPTALLQLESALDALSRKYRFSLYCAYPVLDERGEFGEIHKTIQASHDRVFYC